MADPPASNLVLRLIEYTFEEKTHENIILKMCLTT